MRAIDFVPRNEKVVVIFTRGPHFDLNTDGSGSTGNWVIDPTISADTVLIYLRGKSINQNTVYKGNFGDIIPSPVHRRYIIRFTKMKEIGSTPLNWFDFAGAGRSPVKYIA